MSYKEDSDIAPHIEAKITSELEQSARMIHEMSMENMSHHSSRSNTIVEELEGGTKANKVSGEKKAEEELTPEQKAEKAAAYERANTKAKQLLGGYIKKHRCLLIVGFLLNLVGMVGEFISPLFIGWVIDAIVKKDWDEV